MRFDLQHGNRLFLSRLLRTFARPVHWMHVSVFAGLPLRSSGSEGLKECACTVNALAFSRPRDRCLCQEAADFLDSRSTEEKKAEVQISAELFAASKRKRPRTSAPHAAASSAAAVLPLAGPLPVEPAAGSGLPAGGGRESDAADVGSGQD